jgi:hypothetical protein
MAMTTRKEGSRSLVGSVFQLLALPCNFFAGFLTGLITPLAAIAAMVAGVRLVTGKVPFLGNVWEDEEGDRRLSIKLVPVEEVKDLFAEQKDQLGGDIAKLRAEIEAIFEEFKAESQAGDGQDPEE